MPETEWVPSVQFYTGTTYKDKEVEKIAVHWHTRECLQAQETFSKAAVAYMKRWPLFCVHCRGRGGFEYDFDPSPAGVSLGSGSMKDYSVCTECIEQGKCPRCGVYHPDPEWEGDFCSICGWTTDEDILAERPPAQPTDNFPPEYECFCYERADYPDRVEDPCYPIPEVYDWAADLYEEEEAEKSWQDGDLPF